MMMRPTRTLLLLPFVALLAACSGGDADTPKTPYANTITQMTAFIQKELADSGATGGISIALVDDQTVVWAKSFGYADAGAGILATPDTVYRICSVTKTFTGTMIMQLSDRGLLDIGDPLTRFIPTFSIQPPLGFAEGGPVTIRSILTHHSGIPGDIDNGLFTAEPDPDFNTKLVTYLQGEYLTYPTNFIWAYSNSAISLLATVISNASGESFQTYSDQLFQTLGMDHTSVSIDSPNVATNLAKGYQAGLEVPRFYNNGSTTGAIVSTIQDMAKFIKMVNAGGEGERGHVLKPETLEMMLTPQNGGISLDFDTRIGFIWYLNDAGFAYAGRVCHHAGENPGFRSHLEILRDHHLGVVVLANDVQIPYEEIAKQALKLALQEKTGLTPTPFPEPPYSPAVEWDQARLDALQGVYVFSRTLYASPVPFIRVQSVPGALEWTNPDDGTTIHIVPKANGWLSAPGSQAREYEFSEISGRNVMIWHGKGQSLLAAEYYTPPAIPAAWTTRLGTYEATNCQSVFSCGTGSLFVAEGMLGFDINVLVPVSDTLAYICGLGRKGGSSVQILSVPPDGHEELQLLGIRYRKSANP